METNIENREFIKFLKRNLIFKITFKNFAQRYGDCTHSLQKKIIKRIIQGGPNRYIYSAFAWNNTPQGGTFWLRIHDEWLEKLKELRSC